jgi:hypothetical protein
MPYWISDQQLDCTGWAVVKDEDGMPETVGCTDSKQKAIDTALAIAQAEGEGHDFMGDWADRNASGPDAVICDIDDTLIHAGMRMEKTWVYLQSLPGETILVTGRPDSQRDETVSELEDLGITYSMLVMNDGSTADSNAFKKLAAENLLKTYNITEAIDNNPDARAAYASLNIPTTNPADLPAVQTNRWLKTAHAIVAKLEPVQEVPVPSTRNSKMQTRSALNCELRAETVGDKLKLTGYAAIFNSRSQDLGGFTEVIAPGAFKKSLQARNDIKLLWNHDTSAPLASTRAGTLRLIEDSKGLKVEADLAPTTLGKDISILVQRGDVSAFSFGFNVIKDSWSNSGTERTLEAVRLFEASLVSFPAYEATTGTATVRGLDADQLAEGLLALENGEELSTELATVLVETVNRLIKEPDVQEVQGDILALKKKKLDLLMKGY